MARPPLMWRAVIAGRLPNGEIFNTGFWFQANSPANQQDATDMAVALRTAHAGTALTVTRSLLPPTAAFTEYRVYHYANATGPATSQGVATADTVGTGSPADALPLQVSLVATLETGLPGRRNRGRMYWPMLTEPLPNHQLSEARTQEFASAIADFLSQFNASPLVIAVSVVSQVGAGARNVVTAVSADSEPDIQRRRANRQTELFQANDTVTP